jgi:predicted  nucleic acid-binding Zn-ribbon protein
VQEHLDKAEKQLTTLQDTTQNAQQSLNKSESSATQEFRNIRQNIQKSDPVVNKLQIAKDKEREGFQNLIAGNYNSAIAAFQASEETYHTFHNLYDIARLLKQNKSQMNDPAMKKEVF